MSVTLHRGRTPLVVSVPHAGRDIPDELVPRLVPRALAVEDTDWHLDRLYAFARDIGASLLLPRWSRYVVDLNRPPDDTPMYAGAHNTELCPTRFFSGDPLYRDGRAPDASEIAQRRETHWRPYHDALAGELARVVAESGHAVLWDGHSIRSELPWLFDGRLPDLNLGIYGGVACAPSLRDDLTRALATQTTFTHVVDGRFKGGYITRHHGRPQASVHAVQMEMCWSTYLESEDAPGRWSDAAARPAQELLRVLLATARDWTPSAGEP